GSHVTTAPFEWKLINPSRWPSWKIQTSTPYDAATESKFNRIALIGTTIERNVSSNSRKASPSTNANTIGKRCFTVVLKSREPARRCDHRDQRDPQRRAQDYTPGARLRSLALGALQQRAALA